MVDSSNFAALDLLQGKLRNGVVIGGVEIIQPQARRSSGTRLPFPTSLHLITVASPNHREDEEM